MKFLGVLFLVVLCCLSMQQAKAESLLCAKLEQDSTYKDDNSYRQLIEGKDGWVFRTKTDFMNEFPANSAARDRLYRLNEAFERQGIELVLALIPTRGMMHEALIEYPDFDKEKAVQSYQTLGKMMEEDGFTVAMMDDFSAGQKFYYKRDHHWKADGARALAKQVGEKIKALPLYKEIEKKSFHTQEDGTYKQKGTFSKFANKICESSIPPEIVPDYKTFVDQGDGKETDLFGEEETPAEIILLGTSNSTQSASRSNFDGFLREYIGADVENKAVSGGGVDTAMLAWLASDEYRNKKPKIVIWEIPVYTNYRHPRFYTQMIPSVYGSCTGKSLFEKKINISEKEFAVFKAEIDKAEITKQGHYLVLSFPTYKWKKFWIEVKDKNGKEDKFRFKRSKVYEGENLFFYEFDQSNSNSIDTVKIILPKDAEGVVMAQICSYPTNNPIEKLED